MKIQRLAAFWIWFKNKTLENNQTEPVPGYQVLAKWLKDRKGRVLGFDGLLHYQRVAALYRTLEIQQATDEAIGEWPLR